MVEEGSKSGTSFSEGALRGKPEGGGGGGGVGLLLGTLEDV